MDITKTIVSAVPEDVVADVARRAGTSTVEAQSILGAAAPAILGVIGDRAQSDKKGTQDMLTGVMSAASTKGGAGDILDTVLGSAKERVIADVMKKAGVTDAGIVGKIIEGLLPKVFDGLRKRGISLSQIVAIATTLAALKGGKGGAKGVLGKLAGGVLAGALGKKRGAAGIAGRVLGGLFNK